MNENKNGVKKHHKGRANANRRDNRKVLVLAEDGNIKNMSYSELIDHNELIIADNILYGYRSGEYTEQEIKAYQKEAKNEMKKIKEAIANNPKTVFTFDRTTQQYVIAEGVTV